MSDKEAMSMTFKGFSSSQVEQLTGIGVKTLHFWDRSGFLSPSVGQAHGSGSRRIYSFQDLVALRVAAQLREAGISLQALRKIVAVLRDMQGLDHPLSEAFLVTNGRDVYVKRGADLVSVLRQRDQLYWAFVIDVGKTIRALRRDIDALHSAS